MTRQPDPESKGCEIHYRPAPGGDEEKVRALKTICKRDGIKMKEVFRKAVDKFLKEHNWPPGNPQHPLMEFIVCTPKDENVVQKPKRKEIDYSKLSDEELQALNKKYTRWGSTQTSRGVCSDSI